MPLLVLINPVGDIIELSRINIQLYPVVLRKIFQLTIIGKVD